jgi:hypothetical protein
MVIMEAEEAEEAEEADSEDIRIQKEVAVLLVIISMEEQIITLVKSAAEELAITIAMVKSAAEESTITIVIQV